MTEATWDAAVSDDEELGVAARVGESVDADVQRTAPATGARPVQQKLDVDVAVGRERDVTARGDARVVTTVAGAVERK